VYDNTVHKVGFTMDSISVNQFRDNLKSYVEKTVNEHEPMNTHTSNKGYKPTQEQLDEIINL